MMLQTALPYFFPLFQLSGSEGTVPGQRKAKGGGVAVGHSEQNFNTEAQFEKLKSQSC